MYFKNVAGQGVYLFARDTGAAPVVGKTGDAANISINISKNGGSVVAATNSVIEIGGGYYWLALTQTETNADAIAIIPSSVTANIVVDGKEIYTQGGSIPKSAYGTTGGLPLYENLGMIDSATVADAVLRELIADHDSVPGGLAAELSGMTTHLTDIKGDAFVKANHALDQTSTLTQLNAEVADVLTADTQAELADVPAATPTLAQAIMWLYMQARNQLQDDNAAGKQYVKNDAGATIAEADRSTDGTVFTRGKFHGPGPSSSPSASPSASPSPSGSPSPSASPSPSGSPSASPSPSASASS